MNKFISAVCITASLMFTQAIAQNTEHVSGPVLSGKVEGSKVVQYIPYSKAAGDKAVIATESFAMPRGGATLSSNFNLNGIAPDKKLWLSMYTSGTGHRDAPTLLDSSSQYLLVGGREYSVGSVRGIGFGYVGNATDTAPGFVGIKEVGADQSTNADLIFATRASTANVPLDVRLSITTTGQITAADAYTPKTDQDLTTKKYVDSLDRGVPLPQALRLVDNKPAGSGDACRKGDIHIASEDANQYLYFCVGNLWRLMKLELW